MIRQINKVLFKRVLNYKPLDRKNYLEFIRNEKFTYKFLHVKYKIYCWFHPELPRCIGEFIIYISKCLNEDGFINYREKHEDIEVRIKVLADGEDIKEQ